MQVETGLNDKVIHGLRAQFNQSRVDAILSQAQSMFLQAQFQSGSKSENKPETYELVEGGWIDKATEFLGFGRWAIGRPKNVSHSSGIHAEPMRDRFARHIAHAPSTTSTQSVSLTVPDSSIPDATELFLKHIPKPENLSEPNYGFQNAIEYRNILVIGDQGSGKTTIDQALACGLAQRYRTARFYAAIEHGGIAGLLNDCMRYTADAYMLVGSDLTLAKIPKNQVQAWFEIRHLIHQATGLRRGLVVTALEGHTLFGIEKNLRTSTAMMFLKSVPTNPYDRSLLKRYFDPKLLEAFERERENRPELVLVWDPRHAPHGTLATVNIPERNVLTPIIPPIPRIEWWDSKLLIALFAGLFAFAISAPFWW
jgi:hypothetical protein